VPDRAASLHGETRSLIYQPTALRRAVNQYLQKSKPKLPGLTARPIQQVCWLTHMHTSVSIKLSINATANCCKEK
jgi:hypothetical protein